MSRVKFDEEGQRFYETGVKHTVLYVKENKVNGKSYANGVAWDGVTSINENPSGAETTKLYADDIAYLSLTSNEEFGATIEAYQSPKEFDVCDGTAEVATGVCIGQQERKTFGLSYVTTIGNDELGNEYGKKYHLIYGAKAAPSGRQYSTINESPEAMTLSWELTTTPVPVTGKKPTAIVTIDTSKFTSESAKKILAKFEDILYGVDADEYNSEKTYAVGDYATHTVGEVVKTYECNTANTTGAWEASKWTEIDAGPRLPLPDELTSIFPQG